MDRDLYNIMKQYLVLIITLLLVFTPPPDSHSPPCSLTLYSHVTYTG